MFDFETAKTSQPNTTKITFYKDFLQQKTESQEPEEVMTDRAALSEVVCNVLNSVTN